MDRLIDRDGKPLSCGFFEPVKAFQVPCVEASQAAKSREPEQTRALIEDEIATRAARALCHLKATERELPCCPVHNQAEVTIWGGINGVCQFWWVCRPQGARRADVLATAKVTCGEQEIDLGEIKIRAFASVPPGTAYLVDSALTEEMGREVAKEVSRQVDELFGSDNSGVTERLKKNLVDATTDLLTADGTTISYRAFASKQAEVDPDLTHCTACDLLHRIPEDIGIGDYQCECGKVLRKGEPPWCPERDGGMIFDRYPKFRHVSVTTGGVVVPDVPHAATHIETHTKKGSQALFRIPPGRDGEVIRGSYAYRWLLRIHRVTGEITRNPEADEP